MKLSSCKYLEERFQECSKKAGVDLETHVETLGVDLRTRTKLLGTKEKARRQKCDVTFSLIRKIGFFRKIHDDWRQKPVEKRIWFPRERNSPTERWKLWRQMAAGAGK